jgi:hypothetical protein
MIEKAKLKLKYVDFDLPFVLFLKDSFGDKNLEKWAEAYAAGQQPLPYSRYAPASEKPGGIVIGGGFPVYLPSQDLAQYYEIVLPEATVGLRTLKRVNPHRSSVLMGEVPGDRTGRASFSSVRIIFDLAQISEKYHWDMALFCNMSIRAINHFTDHYRVIANRPYIEHVTVSTIQEFHLTTVFEDGQLQHQEFGGSSGPLNGFGGAISDDLDKKLRESVSKIDPPSIYQTMDLNIRNYFDLEDWRLAIIETAVIFEAWLAKYVRDKFTDQGVSSVDIDAKFIGTRGLPKSVTAIAKELVLDATGFDFSTSTEYVEWTTKVRDLRNDLVHGKRFDVIAVEAKDAYIAVNSAIKLLSTK